MLIEVCRLGHLQRQSASGFGAQLKEQELHPLLKVTVTFSVAMAAVACSATDEINTAVAESCNSQQVEMTALIGSLETRYGAIDYGNGYRFHADAWHAEPPEQRKAIAIALYCDAARNANGVGKADIVDINTGRLLATVDNGNYREEK